MGGALCTRVAYNPEQEILAAGFADGSVIMIEPESQRVLPVCLNGGSAISALSYSSDGCLLSEGQKVQFWMIHRPGGIYACDIQLI